MLTFKFKAKLHPHSVDFILMGAMIKSLTLVMGSVFGDFKKKFHLLENMLIRWEVDEKTLQLANLT